LVELHIVTRTVQGVPRKSVMLTIGGLTMEVSDAFYMNKDICERLGGVEGIEYVKTGLRILEDRIIAVHGNRVPI
jgi:hypothetical protein